jgi:putative ubiquitin-RnfH superfamily antitoxin RatB of RatAB toxin-antitoxin module
MNVNDKMTDATTNIQVAYVDSTGQYLVDVALTPNMTARQALEASGLLEKLPQGMALVVGIFGHKIDDIDEHMMQAGERLEVYRPLTIDPMAVRRKRAEAYPVGRLKRKLR